MEASEDMYLHLVTLYKKADTELEMTQPLSAWEDNEEEEK